MTSKEELSRPYIELLDLCIKMSGRQPPFPIVNLSDVETLNSRGTSDFDAFTMKYHKTDQNGYMARSAYCRLLEIYEGRVPYLTVPEIIKKAKKF